MKKLITLLLILTPLFARCEINSQGMKQVQSMKQVQNVEQVPQHSDIQGNWRIISIGTTFYKSFYALELNSNGSFRIKLGTNTYRGKYYTNNNRIFFSFITDTNSIKSIKPKQAKIITALKSANLIVIKNGSLRIQAGDEVVVCKPIKQY